MAISIIMPTYNRLAFLKEAISSVLAQTCTEWELLISDDGSTDGTREYLEGLSDPRIRTFLQPSHLGQFGQFNFLFERAKYPLAQILCDDDRFADESSLSTLLEMWRTLPEDVGFMRVNHTSDANSQLAKFEKQAVPDYIPKERSDLFMGIFGCIPGSISNISVRVPYVIDAGMFTPEMFYSGDFDLWVRLGRQHPWVLRPEKIVWIRTHEGQVGATQNAQGQAVRQLRQVLEPIYSNLVQRGYSAATLRLLFTINYISQARYIGLKKLLLLRDPTYLRVVAENLDSANFSVSSLFTWPIFFLSVAGKVGRIALAKRLLRQHPKTA